MLMQVLSLTPEQINNLAEPERAAINQLVCPLPFHENGDSG
jgi:hypothetical protein